MKGHESIGFICLAHLKRQNQLSEVTYQSKPIALLHLLKIFPP